MLRLIEHYERDRGGQFVGMAARAAFDTRAGRQAVLAGGKRASAIPESQAAHRRVPTGSVVICHQHVTALEPLSNRARIRCR
jgi:hypothetical protein